ncbi:hypothetical protein BJ742DRAFT_6315 [Cladochytrium replicatum]|nr:hypothetical protein BJ742DRAFT_6315 [Cladochytrium replicatum]
MSCWLCFFGNHSPTLECKNAPSDGEMLRSLAKSQIKAPVLIAGPANSGKTSLAFQFALACAGNQNIEDPNVSQADLQNEPSHVLFISPSKDKMRSRQPCLAPSFECQARSSDASQRVKQEQLNDVHADEKEDEYQVGSALRQPIASQRQQPQANPPQSRWPPPPAILRRIHLRYVKSAVALRLLFASLLNFSQSNATVPSASSMCKSFSVSSSSSLSGDKSTSQSLSSSVSHSSQNSNRGDALVQGSWTLPFPPSCVVIDDLMGFFNEDERT